MPEPHLIAAFANVLDAEGRLDELDREMKGLKETLREHPKLVYVDIPNATVEDMLKELKRDKHQGQIVAFHFGGHAGSKQFIFEGAQGGKIMVDGEELVRFLGTREGLQLVFLNGCATAPLVKSLLAEQIPYVIATKYKVQDKMAADLSIAFYEEIAQGKSIGLAFAAARSQVNLVMGNKREIVIKAEAGNGKPESADATTFRDEILLRKSTKPTTEDEDLPWGLYYQPGLKVESAYLFEKEINADIHLKDKSGNSFILELEELERAGQREIAELLVEKKKRFEIALIYEQDPGRMFSYEKQLEGINEQLKNLKDKLS
ncbi:MAG: CHAT domain-containing protein [Saprospiraceae bacterium]